MGNILEDKNYNPNDNTKGVNKKDVDGIKTQLSDKIDGIQSQPPNLLDLFYLQETQNKDIFDFRHGSIYDQTFYGLPLYMSYGNDTHLTRFYCTNNYIPMYDFKTYYGELSNQISSYPGDGYYFGLRPISINNIYFANTNSIRGNGVPSGSVFSPKLYLASFKLKGGYTYVPIFAYGYSVLSKDGIYPIIFSTNRFNKEYISYFGKIVRNGEIMCPGCFYIPLYTTDADTDKLFYKETINTTSGYRDYYYTQFVLNITYHIISDEKKSDDPFINYRIYINEYHNDIGDHDEFTDFSAYKKDIII